MVGRPWYGVGVQRQACRVVLLDSQQHQTQVLGQYTSAPVASMAAKCFMMVCIKLHQWNTHFTAVQLR